MPEAAPKISNKKCNNIIEQQMSPPLTSMIEGLEDNGFRVNVEKTACVFFNTSRVEKDMPEQISIYPFGKKSTIYASNSAKCLGVIFDKNVNFCEQLDSAYEKGLKALNTLKCVAGKTWGFNPKIKLLLLKNFIIPRMCYGEEIYHTGNKGKLYNLDLLQNAAMRLVAGLPKSTHIKNLERMTDMMPLHNRREMNLIKL